MFKKKSNEKNTYGIVGLGRFGHALALELAAAGAELVVLDKEEEKVRELREYTENAYVVHALDKKTLSETGVQNCDVAVVCIGEQLDISIEQMRNDPAWMNWAPTNEEWAQLSLGTRTGIVMLYETVFQKMLLRRAEIENPELKETMQNFSDNVKPK